MKKILFLILFVSNAYVSYSQENLNKTATKFQSFYNSGKVDSIYYLFSPKMKTAITMQGTDALINKIKSNLGEIVEIKRFEEATPSIEKYILSFERPIVEISLIIKDNLIEGIQQKAPESRDNKVIDETPDNYSVNRSGLLSGTLRLPKKEGKVPVVLMLVGSGPTDRNMNQGNSLKTNSFLMLSDSLAKNGIASVRYDKRGVGKSIKAGNGKITLDDYIADAISFIDTLKADKRFSKVIVMGHSEGSLIGLIASIQDAPTAFVSLSGPADGVLKILEKQLKSKISSSDFKIVSELLDSLSHGKTYNRPLPNAIGGLFNPDNQKFLVSSNKYTSTKEIKKLKIPILIIGGTNDLQVGIDQAKLLSKSNSLAKLKIIDGMNHVLKQSSKDPEANISTYNNPKLSIHPDLTNEIVKFIKSL